jgi:hypothetical protein
VRAKGTRVKKVGANLILPMANTGDFRVICS